MTKGISTDTREGERGSSMKVKEEEGNMKKEEKLDQQRRGRSPGTTRPDLRDEEM